MPVPKFSHEARCLVIVAGKVLEDRIEMVARQMASQRGVNGIEAVDVRKAAQKVVSDQWEELPESIRCELDSYASRQRIAA